MCVCYNVLIGTEELSSLSTPCKNLLQFMLKTLSQCGDNYLIVFKYVHCLCGSGEPFLSKDDATFLFEQVKKCDKFDVEEEELKGICFVCVVVDSSVYMYVIVETTSH